MKGWRPAPALALLLAFAARCAPSPRTAPEPEAPPAPAPSALAPPVPEPLPEPPLPAELRYDQAADSELAGPRRRARWLSRGFSNEAPSPVIRGYGQQVWVQYRTDRLSPGEPAWVEAPTSTVHGAPLPAEKREPCAELLPIGEVVKTQGGALRLTRGVDHDMVETGRGEALSPVKLPRGAIHGACLGPDRRRLWLSWATPERPAELASIGLRDADVRPLRADARPTLGALGELRASEHRLEGGAPAAILEPMGEPEGSVVLLSERTPLSDWDPLARLFPEAQIAVIKTQAPQAALAEAFARARWKGPVRLLLRGPLASAPLPRLPAAWIVSPGDEEGATLPPPSALLVGVGEAARPLVERLARCGGCGASFTIAPGATRAEAEAEAWARTLRWALTSPDEPPSPR